ncbi:hypothetical protein FSP39_004360 [Pinctada imbricata]|uniref:Uncharacterized protein n=1 Tax=Pinctada imbricata TaxID=66713 RepID=A0AA88Y3D1_PINIB|nr:hypothetical protein FSP39_004360 [Pinctada imbricata]
MGQVHSCLTISPTSTKLAWMMHLRMHSTMHGIAETNMVLLRSWLAILLLYSIYCVDFIIGYEETINIDNSCTYSIQKLTEDKSYKLVWNGGDPGYGGCKISFIGRDSEYLNEYTVCAEVPDRIFFQSSGIYLKYYVGFNSYPSKTYTKDDYPDRFCAGQDQYLDVEIEADASSGFSLSRIDTSSSYFTLRITATKTFDYGGTVGAIVGGVIGGLAFLGVAITVCIVIACRRKRYAGQVNRPTTTSMVNQGGNQSAAYPQQTYGQPGAYPQQQMAYPPPTGYTQPGNYPVQGYGFSGQQYQQPPPPQAPDTSAPPPAYGDVTKSS